MVICIDNKKCYGMFVRSNGKYIGKCTGDWREENQKMFELMSVDVEFVEIPRHINKLKILAISARIRKENKGRFSA